ncbi:MAG TPA: N-acetylmuramoyl-L-alanine amidase [Chitinophagaceae bacterium]|nr:N-acetylmuramoyl-L-alanine amidase [Chitinophagaceae bacterium]HQV86772.1 N-acetylmuramoyl-L-alanine amidase [Chitinophagaceae bacterium]HQX73046.1 N-acetylmuramoyl-L-alanine amidase [Chitinophagaceae bacterium]HQZ73388.1 N-acetylmuramoyl-L-alanine amidase [Chitinophagaceae bacterium]
MIRFLRFVCVFWAFSTNAQTIQNNFIAGKTTGILPFLEYGLGIDRLGGAKMTYLDTGVTIKVVDSTIVNYKVQLSKDHFAYLPKQNFQRENDIKLLPYYLTNSWRVSGDDRYDYVTVTLDEKLPYRSMQQINPSKIVVDIFGATGNTNWITQLSTAEEIKNVYHEQLEDDVFRVIIELKNKQHWGYSIYYQEKRLVIRVKRQPAEPDLKNLKVAVDAGHGGDNNGARGITTKILEKEYTLLFAKQLEKLLLDENADVFMTRDKDTTLNMPDRILTLQKEDPHFLISIHLNSSARDSIKGTSTYYRHIGFRPLSQYILKDLLELGLKEFGNIGSFNFALSGPTEYPNCLVEVAFLSNKEDEQLILDPEFHKAVAAQIIAGIKEWLKSCK